MLNKTTFTNSDLTFAANLAAGYKTAPATDKAGNVLTLNEAKSLGLPPSLAGKTEAEIGQELSNPVVPSWFRELAEQKTLSSINGNLLSQMWNEFRNKLLQGTSASTANASVSGIDFNSF